MNLEYLTLYARRRDIMKVAMLQEIQVNRVWQMTYEAEVRAFYFGDLASRYTRRKQIITGMSFFLSSGAAATILASSPKWVPISLSAVAAILTAYSISVNLDRKALTMAKLHSTWNRLAVEYERLWHHWYQDDAQTILEELQDRSIEASESGTEAPYDERLLDKWAERAYNKYNSSAAA